MTDEFERELARSLRSAGRSVVPSPTGYLQIRNKIEVRLKRARRVARVAVGSMSVLVVTVIGVVIATGNSGSPQIEAAAPEEPGLPGYSPEVVPTGMHVVSVLDSHPTDEILSPEFVQVFRSAETDSRIIVRQRPVASSLVAGPVAQLPAGPLEAEIFEQSDGARAVRWTSESGHEYEVSGWDVSDEELLIFAQSHTGEDGALTPILTGGMALVAEGNFTEATSATNFRSFSLESEAGADHLSSIEVTIRIGDDVAFEVVRIYAEQSEWVGENKLLARPAENELLVLWSPSPQLLIETRAIGVGEQELLDFVDRLQPVGDEAWLDLAALAVIDEMPSEAESVLLATASGVIDEQSWSLSWPAVPVLEEEPSGDEPELDGTVEPETEAVTETLESTTTTVPELAPSEESAVSEESEPVEAPSPIESENVVDSSNDLPSDARCLSLFVSGVSIAEQCELGDETQAWLFPVLERRLLVIYSPTGDLITSTSIVALSSDGIEVVDADVTAKGRVWLAWVGAAELFSVTQHLDEETVREFTLTEIVLGVGVEDENLNESQPAALR